VGPNTITPSPAAEGKPPSARPPLANTVGVIVVSGAPGAGGPPGDPGDGGPGGEGATCHFPATDAHPGGRGQDGARASQGASGIVEP
jgi:hypothetical protein